MAVLAGPVGRAVAPDPRRLPLGLDARSMRFSLWFPKDDSNDRREVARLDVESGASRAAEFTW